MSFSFPLGNGGGGPSSLSSSSSSYGASSSSPSKRSATATNGGEQAFFLGAASSSTSTTMPSSHSVRTSSFFTQQMPVAPSLLGPTKSSPSSRSPLSNYNQNTHTGLRQRRGGKLSKTSTTTNAPTKETAMTFQDDSSSFAAAAPPPPKASLSLLGFDCVHHDQFPSEVENMDTQRTLANASDTSSSTGAAPSQGAKQKQQNSKPLSALTSQPFDGTGTSNVLSIEGQDMSTWVVAYGYATISQYDELLQLFHSCGRVLSTIGTCRPGISNWIAIQYESQLEAEKALCHHPIVLRGGPGANINGDRLMTTNSTISGHDNNGNTNNNSSTSQDNIVFCGVLRMTPQLRHSLLGKSSNSSQPMESSFTFGLTNGNISDITTTASSSAFNQNGTMNMSLEEKDILLFGDSEAIDEQRRRRRTYEQRSVCEKLIGWSLGWTYE